jgi:hypothetical protein
MQKPSLLLCLSAIGFGIAAPASAAIVLVPNPGTATEIGIRARNGLTAAEVILFDSQPTVSNKATLNPTGTPVWTYGQPYPFAATWNAATGTLTFSVDFGKNGIAGDVTTGAMRETASFVYPEFIGSSFKTLSLMAQGRSAPSVAMQLTNLVFNGTPLTDLTSPGNTAATVFYGSNVPGEAFATVSLTGAMTFSGNGTVATRPQMEIRLSGPVGLAAVPEPASLLLLAPVGLLALRRRRLA